MFSEIITALGGAFGEVVKLFGDVLTDAFGAIEGLSSGIFGEADAK